MTGDQARETDRAVIDAVTGGATLGENVAPPNEEVDEVEPAENSDSVSRTVAEELERIARPLQTSRFHHVFTVELAPRDRVALSTGHTGSDRLICALHCSEGERHRGVATLERVWCEQGEQVVDVDGP